MSRNISDNPSGWGKTLPGHTVEYDANYAMPWVDVASIELTFPGYQNYQLAFENPDFIYFVDMISMACAPDSKFGIYVKINDDYYIIAAGTGWLNVPLRQNPSLQFIAGDLLEYRLYITDGSDGTYSVITHGTKIIRPSGYGHPPRAYFMAEDRTINTSTPAVFIDDSYHATGTWDWDFGDGSVHSSEQNPTHLYTVPGSYTVKLIVTNAYGWDSVVRTNYITVS
ncbi:TPA_asm: hypothetical protein vir530_00004 [dsDNA virus vir530]|nr:TPA_asm: hypothetical protein vir530_00004 [dsDNA virus vir530]